MGRFLSGENGFGGALVRAGVRLGGQARVGLPVIPSPRQGRHDGVRGALNGGVNQKGTTTPEGVMSLHNPPTRESRGRASCHPSARCSRARTWPSRRAVKTNSAAPGRRRRCRCYGPRRSATRSRNAPAGVPAVMRLDRLDRGPADQREPCLVIRPRWTVVSDSRCLGVSPAQQPGFGAEAERRVMSPISTTNTATAGWANPRMF